jgi:hypothetical protein
MPEVLGAIMGGAPYMPGIPIGPPGIPGLGMPPGAMPGGAIKLVEHWEQNAAFG